MTSVFEKRTHPALFAPFVEQKRLNGAAAPKNRNLIDRE
jgi:hypothetical protein